MIYTSLIGFQFSEKNNKTFKTYNCLLNKENEARFCVANQEETNQAIALAIQAFSSYRNCDIEQRHQFLIAIGEELAANREALIAQFCMESSLSESRANIELDRTIFQLKNYADYLLNSNWNRPIQSNEKFSISTKLHPIGPVVIFGASNFPFAYSTIGGDTVSALVAGCPVIVKSHPMHAGTSCLVAECIIRIAQKLNLPDGVFSHLLDDGHDVAATLIQDERIKAVGFTGSIRGGRALMDLAAKRKSPIPVFAEMGSLNPVVFLPTSLNQQVDKWVEEYTQAISNDAGQFCTKPGLLFLAKNQASTKFVRKLQQQLNNIEAKCHLHPHLFTVFKAKVSAYFEWIECNLPFHSQPCLRVVESDEFMKNEFLREEFFGPQSIAIFYEDFDELLSMLGLLGGQLTGTLIGDENSSEFKLLLDVLQEKAGRIILNGVPTGVTVCDAMVHGGVYPAASDSRFTAVGNQSVYRFLRPIALQKGRS